ncbi:DUF1750-domain-containing protein [Lophium mytilinum]|uniref:DUF1750-domain-containing protein n=1 Tax=Lophium mytilinum TaxID=390894 RepID=A0A6A6QU45_9PEZI|nr:DUF1750-domain-containing protein [Lophium mytilinum]
MAQNHVDVRMGQDPSSNVPQFVLPHVHLVSSYRFPHQAQLQPNIALDYLLNAPKIVNDAQPVAWTYFQAPPPDGTVILTWQPPHMGNSFASDGYTWADEETSYKIDIRGYTLEILVHRSGCRYGVEQLATHSRHRYRIIDKNPAANAPFDPNLWIVHYTQAAPDCRFPAAQIQIRPDVQRVIQERIYLEKQGQLQRKEFMLRDRGNWPDVKFAPSSQMHNMAAQGRPMFNPMQPMGGAMARQAQYYQQPQAPTPGGPPAKRMRQVPPSQMPGTVGGPGMPPTAVGADTSIEDEENTTLGDLLDHLTPREISTMRYTQHHEWMEEVFSSPYAVGQILPVDLGLGLMGELAPLTDGLLDAPSADSLPSAPNKSKSYHKLDPEQLADFEKRVEEYTKKEEAELAKMRADHARKLANLKRSKTYIKAERRLREAAHSPGHNISTTLPEETGDELSPQPPRAETPKDEEKPDAIVAEIEALLGVKIGTQKSVICVDKGGFIEEQVQPVQVQQPVNGTGHGNGGTNGQGAAYESNGNDDSALNGLLEESAMDADNTAASLLDQYGGSTSLATTPANPAVLHGAQTGSGAISSVGTPGVGSSTLMGQSDGANDLMDLDVEMAGMGDGKGSEGEGDWVMVNEAANAPQTTGGQPKADNSTATSARAAAPASNTETGTGLFDTTDSFSFDNLDTAGDALADYANADDDLGLALEDSAFGDAFHGTEVHESGED